MFILSTSRTENTIKNSSFGFITQIVNILLSFVARTAFIYILGVEYLGVNGLFTNVLLLLSFAELGIGNAIIYSMYKPIATDDREKIKSLMQLYAKAYKFIGLFVFFAGLIVIPFMDFIIKDAPDINENITVIYLLFLLNTTLSYFFVYKKSIITADQKNYIVLLYHQLFRIIQTVVQIAFLLLTGEYLLFLIIQIVFTLLNNVYMSFKADKMYPYLKAGKTGVLEKKERDDIFSNVKSLFLYKFGSVVLNGTDNIIISALIGVAAVGLSSNYLLVLASLSAVAGQMMNGFTASVGNLNAIGDSESKERVFNRIFFVSAWMYGFFSVGLFIFLNKFITIWLGDEFLLSQLIVFAVVLHFYVNSLHFAAYTYRITMGLFVKGRLAPVAAAIINIVLSFWLGKIMGLAGIFFATSIARFFTTGIVDPVLVYKTGFNKSPVRYYLRYFLYAGLFAVLGFALNYLITFITVDGVLGFALQVALVSVLFNVVMFLIFRKNNDFIEIRKAALRFIKRKSAKKN